MNMEKAQMMKPQDVPAPEPFGPIPSPRQLSWHTLEFYGFLHFTVNTFTDQEWGYGDESPEVFAPTDFDAHQIAQVAVEGGMTGLILTCKHHDGFCLWPSRFTGHSVKRSPWQNGRGDVVREVADAIHAAHRVGASSSRGRGTRRPPRRPGSRRIPRARPSTSALISAG